MTFRIHSLLAFTFSLSHSSFSSSPFCFHPRLLNVMYYNDNIKVVKYFINLFDPMQVYIRAFTRMLVFTKTLVNINLKQVYVLLRANCSMMKMKIE